MPYDPNCFYYSEQTPETKLYWRMMKKTATLADFNAISGRVFEANQVLYNGRTLVEAAIASKEPLYLKRLIRLGVDIYVTTPDGVSNLRKALRSTTPSSIIALLIKHDPHVNIRFTEEGSYNPPTSYMDLALNNGDIEVYKLLVKAGFKLNTASSNGNSFLQLAVCLGHEEIVLDMLKRGVSKSPQGLLTYSCLHSAAKGGNAILRSLLTVGKPVTTKLLNMVDNAGYTPLFTAVVNGLEVNALLLMDHGASIDAHSSSIASQGTLLLYALARGYGDLALRLLECGADPSGTYNGSSALQLAADNSLHKVIAILDVAFAEHTKKALEGISNTFGVCNSGKIDAMAAVIVKLKNDGVDIKKASDISWKAAEAVAKRVDGSPVVILGRDAETLFWILKEKLLPKTSYYYLLSRLICNNSMITDQLARMYWRKEVPKGAYVVDTGYAGSIITAIRRSVDKDAHGLLISSSGVYEQLAIKQSISHGEIVVELEKLPKPIGRCSAFIQDGAALCPQTTRDSDERLYGMNPEEVMAMRLLMCDELGLSRNWAHFTGRTQQERMHGPASLSVDTLLGKLAKPASALLSGAGPLYHCGSPTCVGCGVIPKSPSAKLVSAPVGEVSHAVIKEIQKFCATTGVKPALPMASCPKGTACKSCKELWDMYDAELLAWEANDAVQQEAKAKLLTVTEGMLMSDLLTLMYSVTESDSQGSDNEFSTPKVGNVLETLQKALTS